MARIKNIILLALTALMVVGCRYKATGKNIRTASNPVVIVDENTLDSCEYYPKYGHKGNCRFCKERDSIKWEKRKNELEELIIKLKEK